MPTRPKTHKGIKAQNDKVIKMGRQNPELTERIFNDTLHLTKCILLDEATEEQWHFNRN